MSPSNSYVNSNGETKQFEYCDNVDLKVIEINESKAKYIYVNYIEKKPSLSSWLSFFGIFLTCLTTSLTSTFSNILNIENSGIFLKGVFWTLTIVFFVLCIIFLIRYLRNIKKYTCDKFIELLRSGE